MSGKLGDSIPVTLIGCGAAGRFLYAPALSVLREVAGLSVTDLVDPVLQNAEKLRDDFFPTSRCWQNLDDVELRRDALVVVASPVRYHADHSIRALERGASVLCEKPMAMDIPEAEKMLEAERSAKGFLAVGHVRRFFPAVEFVHSLQKAGTMGALKSVDAREGGKFDWAVTSQSFFDHREIQGGVLLDIGIHVFDLLIYCFGDAQIQCYEDDAMGGQEANCRARLRFTVGANAELRLSRDWETDNRYCFHFDKGDLDWRADDPARISWRPEDSDLVLSGELNGKRSGPLWAAGGFPQSFMRQLLNVTRALRGEEALRTPGQDAIRALLLVSDCYRRATPMKMPWFSAEEEVGFRALRQKEGMLSCE